MQKTAVGATEYWGNSYGYDAWGNLLQKTPTKCSAENLSVTALANDQLSGYGYDAAGNMTHDASTGNNYSYDQENRITGAGGYTYTYDADGNRVEKSNGSTGTIYWYMTPGIVAESDLSGNLKSEYMFFDGERVARKDFPSNAVSYYFSDHLKTASVITDSAGNIKEDEDYYPWGGEIQFVNNDTNQYKFTGKERDSETGLDYFGARYYGNWVGRFMTPDWSKKPEDVPYAVLSDPQSLNLYSYVRNIPTTSADIDGHQSLDSQRQAAVRRAWAKEQELVQRTGQGTHNWTPAEKAELIRTGRVSGYVGHHINSVNGNPGLAGEQNNVKFVKGQAENLAEHGGNFRNPTSGPLMNRVSIFVQVLGAIAQGWSDYKFNQHESETGLRSDALFGVRISNVDKAAQSLDPGAQTKLPDGEVFTLGKDRVWRNVFGDTLYYDDKSDTNKVRRHTTPA